MRRLTFEEVTSALWSGDVVAVPTDTVYGVAARLLDASAVSRLFEVKSRPRDVALPVMVASAAAAGALEVEWSERAEALARHFWPGALTIVVSAGENFASLVGASTTLGLRVPHHDGLCAIIAACGPLAVTSANEHGHPPCTNVDEVLATRWGAPVAGVLDGGRCGGAVSSVVEVTAQGWHLRREGSVSASEIAAVVGPESRSLDQ